MKKFPRLLLRASTLAAAFSPAAASAHPGHDGDHDFTWTFSHLAAHPFATLACFAVIAAGACLAWHIAQWAAKIPPKSQGRTRYP